MCAKGEEGGSAESTTPCSVSRNIAPGEPLEDAVRAF